jgi:hypothetical protein
VRIIWCGVKIAGTVEGFNWVEGSRPREWNVERKKIKLNQKRKRRDGWWTEDPMDVDDPGDNYILEEWG